MSIKDIEIDNKENEVIFVDEDRRSWKNDLNNYLKFGTTIRMSYKPFLIKQGKLVFNLFKLDKPPYYDYYVEWFDKISLKVSQEIFKEFPFADKYKDIEIYPSKDSLVALNEKFIEDLNRSLEEDVADQISVQYLNRLIKEMKFPKLRFKIE